LLSETPFRLSKGVFSSLSCGIGQVQRTGWQVGRNPRYCTGLEATRKKALATDDNPAPVIHLRLFSRYSPLEGALHIAEIAKRCLSEGMPAAGLTDSGNLFGALDFATNMCRAGIQPIIGCTLPLSHPFAPSGEGFLSLPPIALLAATEAGFRNLLRLVSSMYLGSGAATQSPRMQLEAIGQEDAEGLICLTGGARGAVGALLRDNRDDGAAKLLHRLAAAFDRRLYVEIQRHGVGGQLRTRAEEDTEPALVDAAYRLGLPLVATTEAYFGDADFHEAHGVLRGIDGGKHREPHETRYTPENRFRSSAELRHVFADLPEALENTVDIARRVSFCPTVQSPVLPRYDEDENKLLRTRAREGLEKKLTAIQPAATADDYRKRLEYELDVIVSMNFAGYFLIVADFVNWAQAQDIPVGPGRGSGAGSLVAYALRIVDVDPMRYGLLFERFLNPERVSMPDFDIDFCEDRRDEVIEYVRERYGPERVAKIVTFNTLQARAALHDTGRVLGAGRQRTDRLASAIPNQPANPVSLSEAIESVPEFQEAVDREEGGGRLFHLARRIEGLIRNPSIHAAGIVIGNRPLMETVPLFRDPGSKDDFPAIQYEMKWVEPAGLVKFDFLGLKAQTTIRAALRFLEDRGEQLDLAGIPMDDPQVLDLYCRAETSGLFQVEKEGMQQALRQMQPDRFEDLIAVIALYRPGPMDNIPEFCAIKHGQKKVKYLHPQLEPILAETYGIIVYQEQVMEIARSLAGFSLGEADILRRAMGKKDMKEMEAQRQKFLDGLQAHARLDRRLAEKLYELVERFANYGFNKSHAAAYALVSYHTAYLKAHHPLEFFAATLDSEVRSNDKNRFQKAAAMWTEARRRGVDLLPPDVNHSCGRFRPLDGRLPYALGAIKGVSERACENLVAAREAGGPFTGLGDLARRVPLAPFQKQGIENLALAGAFDSLDANRHRIARSAEDLVRYSLAFHAAEDDTGPSLFGERDLPKCEPTLSAPQGDDMDARRRFDDEQLVVGFPISDHPLNAHREKLLRGGIAFASSIQPNSSLGRYRAAAMVTEIEQRVSRSGKPFRRIALSDPEGAGSVLMFSEAFERCNGALSENSLVVLDLEVSEGRNREGLVSCRGLRSLDDLAEPPVAGTRQGDTGLSIRISDAAAAGAVLHALGDSVRETAACDQVQLRFALRIEPLDVWVEMDVPGRLPFTAETRRRIATTQGVLSVAPFDPSPSPGAMP